MKQSQMNPVKGRAFHADGGCAGRRTTVGTWAMIDYISGVGLPVRVIEHYGTVMGRFVGSHRTTPLWTFEPASVGWGSVSDQQGMNKIVQGMGGWYYSRRGGAEWVQR